MLCTWFLGSGFSLACTSKKEARRRYGRTFGRPIGRPKVRPYLRPAESAGRRYGRTFGRPIGPPKVRRADKYAEPIGTPNPGTVKSGGPKKDTELGDMWMGKSPQVTWQRDAQ